MGTDIKMWDRSWHFTSDLKKGMVEEVSLIVEWEYGNKYQNVRSILTPHSQYLKDMLKGVY